MVAVADSPNERGFAAEIDAAGVVEAEVVADVPKENVGFGTKRGSKRSFSDNFQKSTTVKQ